MKLNGMNIIQGYSVFVASLLSAAEKDGTTRVTQMSLPSEFYLPWSPWTLACGSCCRPFCNAIIFLSLRARMISYWNTLRLEWRRPVVVFFHIAVPSGFFSVRRRCVHSVRAVTDFLTYVFRDGQLRQSCTEYRTTTTTTAHTDIQRSPGVRRREL